MMKESFKVIRKRKFERGQEKFIGDAKEDGKCIRGSLVFKTDPVHGHPVTVSCSGALTSSFREDKLIQLFNSLTDGKSIKSHV